MYQTLIEDGSLKLLKVSFSSNSLASTSVPKQVTSQSSFGGTLPIEYANCKALIFVRWNVRNASDALLLFKKSYLQPAKATYSGAAAQLPD